MSIESITQQFEWLMRSMVETHECAQGNIESAFRRVIRDTVHSCATMYGFSAEEALKRLNSNGEINEVPVLTSRQKELEKAEKLRLKEAEKFAKEAEKLALKEAEKAEKAEKLRLKEAEKAKKLKDKEFEKIEALRRKEYENSKKANESSERTLMKEEEVLSKAAEKLRLKEAEKALKKSEKPAKKTKKVKKVEEDSDASTVIMSASEDEEPHVLFQNIPLMNEINSIRDVKKFKNWKKLSAGVKLARQILDI